jgi:two-component system, chemotaxis family, CheB/CheR fusion protein
MDYSMKAIKDGRVILSDNMFPVVGIGASAGGLEAFKKLIGAIPEDSGMAYVLVQHLDPGHESVLPELLQKVTNVPVLEISNDIQVMPDHIYILPSNKMLIANDGVLELSPRPPKSKNVPNLPIDLFFTSLAQIHRSHAIGVVLSGTGSDGTNGLRAIKGEGGTTFAQDQQSAAFGGMPANAAGAGVVDFILPPDQIPDKLLEIKHHFNPSDGQALNTSASDDDSFRQILSVLRIWKGTDFTYYKQTTIRRRVLRRMSISKTEDLLGYLEFLRGNRAERDALFQDLLIAVTEFFRDEKAFNYLHESVFPAISDEKNHGEPFRIWIVGCSTGQEAYSVAICLMEFLGDLQRQVQVFATDISGSAITKARAGFYSDHEMKGISSHRLQEFFTKTDGGYLVNKEIRNICVFAVHNFLQDPPFGKMDLVSCRNVLIYLEPYLQKKALTTFHYALNLKGFLLLGKSETNQGATDLFSIVSKQDKFFTRKDVPGKFMLVASRRNEQSLEALNTQTKNDKMQTDFQKAADELMLSKYTPAGVVINQAMDIVHFRGSTTDYLQQAAGKPSHHLLKMAKDGLAFELHNLVNKVKQQNTAVSKENIRVKVPGAEHTLSIEVIPLPNLADPHYLILFHKNLEAETPDPQVLVWQKTGEDALRIREMEMEMVQTYADIRSMTEQQEAANEELQSANEELLSGSEELQSLNEELQASKEELQSSNEQLTFLNQQLHSLNEKLTAARNYAESIVATVREPLLVLGHDLRVKTANSAFYKTFQVDEKQTEGVSIYELGNGQWDIPQLRVLLEENLPRKTNFIDFEVSHDFASIGQRVMLVSACEITGENQEEKLILLAIEDITQRKQLQIEDKLFGKQLEAKVAQRTNELSLANESMWHKNEELARMNRELASFSYVASHDLQEPLRKIQTFAGLILKKEYEVLSASGKDYFQRMHHAASRMQTLIEDLLVYSHSSITERKFERTDLSQIVEEVKFELKDAMIEKSAVIESFGLGEAWVNPFQFRQVINNLAGNALKFSKPGVPAKITIIGETKNGKQCENENSALLKGRLLADKNYFHINFHDNGIGFDQQYQERIFVVFQRLHGKEQYPGTGIGLAIVKKIIENHNGIITARSEAGKGARFDIYIPDNQIPNL